MADVHAYMQKKLAEYRKKNPELAYRFIDTTPDILKIRTQIEGWNVIKEPGSGTAGEVRIGDLILAAKPRSEVIEEQKRLAAKSKQSLEAPMRQYYSKLELDSGGYIVPISPEELSRNKSNWSRR